MMWSQVHYCFGVGVAMAALALIAVGAASAASQSTTCPQAWQLERPARLRGAIPAAKRVTGGKVRVLELKRGPRSTYAASARRLCGSSVLRKSVYVRLHPVGMRCASCDSRLYMVKNRESGWELWTSF
jgi:hypothetical protein